MKKLTGTLAAILALACAASAQRHESIVDSDLAYARGLAERYRFNDLAEEVLTKVEAAGVSESGREDLALAKCDVYGEGARYELNAEQRLVLYDKAIDAYGEFIEAYPFSPQLSVAQRSYVDLSNSYAQALERALEEALGEEAASLRDKIRAVLEGGLELTGDLIDELSGSEGLEEERELFRLMLNRSQMLLTNAKVSEGGSFYFSKAEEQLEELALAAGETTAWGLRAYLLLMRVRVAQGEYRDAIDFGEYVLTTAVPRERTSEGWIEMPFAVKSERWKMVELGASDLFEALNATGDSADATDWALYYYNAWRGEGFELSPLGYLSLIGVARSLLQAGGYVPFLRAA